MEEHPPKRRRLETFQGLSAGRPGLIMSREPARSLGDKREIIHLPKLALPASGNRPIAQRVEPVPKIREDKPTKINARQLFPTQANGIIQPAADSVSTVLAVAVVDNQGNVSEVNVPMGSKGVWIPGYGVLTMPSGATAPTLTASERRPSITKSNPAAVTPPPAIAASQARAQAIQSQEAIAKQLNVVPQAPPTGASTPPSIAPAPSSAGPNQRASSSQDSMSIAVPESHSQQILSSPSTPIPATPQSSTSSSASYFSSSLASLSSPSSSHTPSASTSSQTPTMYNTQLPVSTNSIVPFTNSPSSTATETVASSLSPSSLSSGASAAASSFSLQSATSQASLSSVGSLTAESTATGNPSGFATSTRNSQSLTSGPTQANPTSTTLASSALPTSQFSSQSASVSSLSGGASSTGLGAGGVGGNGNSVTASSPTSSAAGASGDSNGPPTPVLVGGIVGGVAGAAMILLVLLLLFRWRQNRTGRRKDISPPMPRTLGPGDVPQTGSMTQRSSSTPIAAAGFFNRLRPTSAQTATTADTAPSERGFQKISGRKLPSVLAAGGDGYGSAPPGAAAGPPAAVAAGGIAARNAGGVDAAAGSSSWATASSPSGTAGPANRDRDIGPDAGPVAGLPPASRPSPPHSLSGSSFYRDSTGFYGGIVTDETTRDDNDALSSPSSSSSYPTPLNIAGIGSSSTRLPHNRPGPARTPVINEPATIPIRTPSRARQQPPRLAQATPSPQNPFRDGLGRSHPSQDGSRGSRFKEDTTPP